MLVRENAELMCVLMFVYARVCVLVQAEEKKAAHTAAGDAAVKAAEEALAKG